MDFAITKEICSLFWCAHQYTLMWYLSWKRFLTPCLWYRFVKKRDSSSSTCNVDRICVIWIGYERETCGLHNVFSIFIKKNPIWFKVKCVIYLNKVHSFVYIHIYTNAHWKSENVKIDVTAGIEIYICGSAFIFENISGYFHKWSISTMRLYSV